MGDYLSWVRVECLSCGRNVVVDGSGLAEKLSYDKLSLKNIVDAVPLLKCDKCAERSVRVFDNRERLLFDADNPVTCAKCEAHIPLPRLSARPNTTMCIECTEKGELEPVAPPYSEPHQKALELKPAYFKPPAELSVCPRCNAPGVVRHNSHSGARFVGCSTFPDCRWTASLPDGRP